MRSATRWLTASAMTLIAAVSCKAVLGLGDPAPSPPDASTDTPGMDGAVADGAGDGAIGEIFSPVCNANLITNPKHCGRCDHDCRGSTCQAGHCVPVLVGSLEDGTGVFTVNQGNIFASDGDKIVKLDPKGGRTNLATSIGATPLAIFVDQSYVLWSSEGSGVLACPIVGCSGPPLRVSASTRTGPIIALPGLASPWQYIWVDYPEPTRIVMALPDGGSRSLVNISGVDEFRCGNFALGGSKAYFTDGPRNQILALGPDLKWKVAAGVEAACAIAAFGDHVYFTDNFNVWSAAIKPDGSLQAPITIANGQDAPRTIAADSEYVYWASYTETPTSIYRCKSAGCDLKPEVIVAGLPRTIAVRADETWLYFSVLINRTVGAEIWKVAK